MRRPIFVKEKNNVLIRKLHPIKQTMDDIRKNMLKKDGVILNAIKNGIVLHGYEKIIGLVKNVTSKE